MSSRLTTKLCWILAICGAVLSTMTAAQEDGAERLFRQALQDYRTRFNRQRSDQEKLWQPWSQLATQLLSTDDENHNISLLQRIGALEESILTIERAIYETGQPDDTMRDRALAQLYYAYAKLLIDATPDDCFSLAKDPHTLLIGADQVTEPSTFICRENAENHLRNAITLDATHVSSEELLAQLLQDTTSNTDGIHQRKPKEFVAELFDSFADTFDEKLVKGLAYQVPTLIGQAASDTTNKNRFGYQAILDAGCGTGLAGRHLRPLLVPPSNGGRRGLLIGVDASEKMLEIARQCTLTAGCGLDSDTPSKNDDNRNSAEQGGGDVNHPLYDGLFAMDLEEMSVQTTLLKVPGEHPSNGNLPHSGFDLVVAADVLVYFGRLDDILAKFAEVSIPGAALIFSCERTTLDKAPLGWRLLPTGRFAHTKDHVVQAAEASGYLLEDYVEIVPRMEKGEPVQGHMFTFVLSNGGKAPQNEL